MKKFSHAFSLSFRVDTDREPHEQMLDYEILEAVIRKIMYIHAARNWKETLDLPWDTRENEETYSGVMSVSRQRLESSTDMAVKVITSSIAGACSALKSTGQTVTIGVDLAVKN